MAKTDNIKYIARNRKALHNYEIRQKLEAGIELLGTEVKSLRAGNLNLSDSYAVIESGQVILRNLHIGQYKMATQENHEPLRPRRLLLHKREIRKLFNQTEQRGMALIPLAIYFKGKLVKVELGVGLGRKKYDKRQAVAEADAARRIKQALKRNH